MSVSGEKEILGSGKLPHGSELVSFVPYGSTQAVYSADSDGNVIDGVEELLEDRLVSLESRLASLKSRWAYRVITNYSIDLEAVMKTGSVVGSTMVVGPRYRLCFHIGVWPYVYNYEANASGKFPKAGIYVEPWVYGYDDPSEQPLSEQLGFKSNSILNFCQPFDIRRYQELYPELGRYHLYFSLRFSPNLHLWTTSINMSLSDSDTTNASMVDDSTVSYRYHLYWSDLKDMILGDTEEDTEEEDTEEEDTEEEDVEEEDSESLWDVLLNNKCYVNVRYILFNERWDGDTGWDLMHDDLENWETLFASCTYELKNGLNSSGIYYLGTDSIACPRMIDEPRYDFWDTVNYTAS